MEDLILKQEIFQSEKDTVRIYGAIYNGELCYCIHHHKTDAKMIFDYDAKLVEDIKRKIGRTKGLTVDRKKNGCVFKIHSGEHEHSISLRLYLYAKYKGLPLRKVSKSRIALHNESAKTFNIYDFRQKNLYEMGHKEDKISIINRPNHPDEKYICITVGDRTELYDYSRELYDLLTSKMLGIGYNKSTQREYVTVHYEQRREGYSIYNLSKFTLLFYRFFERYQRMNGAEKRFIKNLSNINREFDYECGHVDAITWNNSKFNIMPMASEANQGMRDYIRDFQGRYCAGAIVLPQEGDIILVELANSGRSYYFLCDTPEDFCDLQKQLLGKTPLLSDKSLIRLFGVNGKVEEIDTPRQVYDKGRHKPTKEFSFEQFWKWCDMRDHLQLLYEEDPKRFFVWRKWNENGVNVEQAIVISLFLSPL